MYLLVIEDDELTRIGMCSILEEFGRVESSKNAADGILKLKSKNFDMAFIDLDLESELIGLDVITVAKEREVYSVVISGRDDDESIIKAYSRGCQDYLAKPYNKDAIERVIRSYKIFKNTKDGGGNYIDKYITSNINLISQLNVIHTLIKSDIPLFIDGPTGVGKSYLAKLIHQSIFDINANFVELNCSAFPENLLESELFGYVKGAFSGANEDKRGKLSLADGGTLFLDEIGTMPVLVQQKLLKAIEEQSFYPLGSDTLVKCKFQLISATCENIYEMVKRGEFRRDLFYRIDGPRITLPPLRNRKDDIELLINHFNREGDRRVVYGQKVIKILKEYSWPGNIRELKKIVQMLQTKSNGVVQEEDLPLYIRKKEFNQSNELILTRDQCELIREIGLIEFVKNIELEAVNYVMKANNYQIKKSMGELKLSNSVFYRIKNQGKKCE